MAEFKEMKKSPGKILPVETYPVTGEHYLTIPEWICDENGWHEGTEVLEVDGDSMKIADAGQVTIYLV